MNKLITILLLITLASCGASKKNQRTQKQSFDSTRTITIDTIDVSKIETKAETKNNIVEESSTETIVEFDNDTSYSAEWGSNDTTTVPESLLRKVFAGRNVKSVTIKDKRKKIDNSITVNNTTKTDSTAKKQADITNTKHNDESSNTIVNTKQWSVWGLLPWYVWLILALVFVGILWWKLPFLFKRNKSKTI